MTEEALKDPRGVTSLIADYNSTAKRIRVDANGNILTSDNTPALAVLLDEASDTVTYVGKAAIGSLQADAVWQLFKLTQTGTVLSITWADGNSDFDNVWNNRASLTYS